MIANLEDVNGKIDLSTATSVKLYMKKKDGTVKIDGKDMAISNATAGEVKYDWDTSDVDEAGVFHIEISVTFPIGTQIVPNYGYQTIIIDESIG